METNGESNSAYTTKNLLLTKIGFHQAQIDQTIDLVV